MNFRNDHELLLTTDLALGWAGGDTGTEVIKLLTCGITLAWRKEGVYDSLWLW